MSKLFDLDSPLMRILNKVADLMILNVATLLFCVPGLFSGYVALQIYMSEGVINLPAILMFVVLSIPIGSALTGMHFVLLKMVRGDEAYIIKDFWKSFKLNFKQASVIWLIFEVAGFLLIADYKIYMGSDTFPKIMLIMTGVVAIVIFIIYIYVFPVLSRFSNTIANTIKNSFLMSVLGLPRTLGMILITGASFALPVLGATLIYRIFPLYILFGLSLPGFLCALLYSPLFKRFEPEVKEEKMSTEEELLEAARAIQGSKDEDYDEVAKIIQDDGMDDEDN
ncbi:YesL family protein [Butyrivibrio fibrisolvens]|uniref:YesL family protein n=1 Tax=Butyrivibrio fibrisolvens TaxID=831 RepID=UPI000685A3E7|nr:YesL family protein [Butyrivibrio fibrisolvens]